MSTGERIKKIRKDRTLTQIDFGKILGISHSHVSKLEANKERPSETLIRLICAEFYVNREWLVEGIGTEYDKEDLPENWPAEEIELVMHNQSINLSKTLLSSNNPDSQIHSDALFMFQTILEASNIRDDLKPQFKKLLAALTENLFNMNIYYYEINREVQQGKLKKNDAMNRLEGYHALFSKSITDDLAEILSLYKLSL